MGHNPSSKQEIPVAVNFQEVLNLQHRWPWASWTAQLFPKSAWWAARQMTAFPEETMADRSESSTPLGPELMETEIPVVAEGKAAAAPSLGRVLFIADQALSHESLALLTRMAQAMQLPVENFAIWPNSEGGPWEAMLENFRPKIVLALGSAALEMLIGRRERLSQIHGNFMPFSHSGVNGTLMPIFHPDFLLINPAMKRPVWLDLQKVMRFLAE